MKEYAQEVLAAALANGGDFAEIFMEDTRSSRMQLLNSDAESINFSRLHGAGHPRVRRASTPFMLIPMIPIRKGCCTARRRWRRR